MFRSTENKKMQSGTNGADGLRANLAKLEGDERGVLQKLETAKQQIRETRTALDEAEASFVAGVTLHRDLESARRNAAAALEAVGPVEVELEQARSLIRRCRELMTEATRAEQAAARAELQDKFQAWRKRYVAALTAIVLATGEGEEILAEAERRCPDFAGENIAAHPLRNLTPRLLVGSGYAPRPAEAVQWLFQAVLGGVEAPSATAALLGPWRDELAKLDAANQRCAALRTQQEKDLQEECEAYFATVNAPRFPDRRV